MPLISWLLLVQIIAMNSNQAYIILINELFESFMVNECLQAPMNIDELMNNVIDDQSPSFSCFQDLKSLSKVS